MTQAFAAGVVVGVLLQLTATRRTVRRLYDKAHVCYQQAHYLRYGRWDA